LSKSFGSDPGSGSAYGPGSGSASDSGSSSRSGPVGVALVGAGVISTQYLTALSGFPDVRVLAVADLDVERARAAAHWLASAR